MGDPALLDGIPGDRPVLVVAEGLLMYLTEQDGPAVLRRIPEHFTGGELVCDVRSRLATRLSTLPNGAVRAAGARLAWGIDSGSELARAVPGLVLDEEVTFFEIPGIERLHPLHQTASRAMAHLRAFRRMALLLRMHFDT